MPTLLAQKPWDPTPRPEDWWHQRHRAILESNAQLGNQIKVVFLGSSLVEFWGREGKQVWDQHYAPAGAVNYGIGGDRTEHVLWRIDNGELDKINPKLVVVYIGSNNVPVFPDNDEIVRGVNTVVDRIHDKLPNTNILLVGTFPRADVNPVRKTLERIRDIDYKLIKLVDGDTTRRGHFLDLFWKLAASDMESIFTQHYIADKLHFNHDGYSQWQREMNTLFQQLTQ